MNATEPVPRETRPIRRIVGVLAASAWLLAVVVLMRFDASFRLSGFVRTTCWGVLVSASVLLLVPFLRRGLAKADRGVLPGLAVFGFLFAAVVALPSAGGHLRRAVLPWTDAPAAPLRFRFVVSSKDVVAVPGESITLGGYLARTLPDGQLPDTVELQGDLGSHPSTVDADGSFAVTVPARSGSYRFVAGSLQSESHRVECRDAVALLPGSRWSRHHGKSANRIAADLGGTRDLQADAAAPFSITAGGRCEWLLIVRQTPAEAEANWTTPGNEAAPIRTEIQAGGVVTVGTTPVRSGLVAVTLKLADGAVGHWRFPVNVEADRPPQVVSARGLRTPMRLQARPGARVEWFLKLQDDVAVTRAVLEFRNEADAELSPAVALNLKGLGTTTAEGRVAFSLPTTGGTVRVRLLIDDDAPSGPRVMLPANGFHEFALTATAPPLDEQTIARDAAEWRQTTTALEEHLQAAAAALSGSDGATRIRTATERIAAAESLFDPFRHDYADGPEFAAPLRLMESPRTGVMQARAAAEAALFDGDAGRLNMACRELERRLRDWASGCATSRAGLDGVTARRLAAAGLRHEAEAWPAGPVAPETNVGLRLQLEGRIAQHAVLRQTVTAAATAERADFRRRLFVLEADHRAWCDQLRSTRTQARSVRVERLRNEFRTLPMQAERSRTWAAASARVLGLPVPDAAWAEPVDRAFAGASGFTVLTELEKAAARWDHDANRMRQSIAARGDPREALRQLNANLDDLQRRRAEQPNAADAVEVLGLLDFYRSFDRRRDWDDAPLAALAERLREQAPEASIVEALRETIRRLKAEWDALPTAEQRRATDGAAWAEWKRDTLRRLRDAERNPNAAPVLPSLPIPSRDDLHPSERHALEQLTMRADGELREGLGADAAVTLRELLRRAEAIPDRPNGKPSADDILLEAAHNQTTIAAAWSATWTEGERAAAAGRQRELNGLLTSSALVALSRLYSEAWEACRTAEDGVRLGRPTAGAELETARERLDFVASKRIGAVSDRRQLSALRAGLANLTASDGKLSRVRAAEVIADLRFGKSVAAKATLLARLERGPVAATPESGKQFTAELTILFDRAAAALAAYPRSDHVAALRGPAPADERTRLMRQAKPGRLPDAADGPELHAVAADLRRLRDEVGVRLDDGLGEPPTAAQTASWEELRREADELTRTAARLASRAVPGTAEETAQRAVLLPLQTLADLWRPIRIEQAMIRVATVDVLTASSRDLLMRVKFRAAGQPSEVDERAARIGRQLRTAAEHLARGETIPANGAVQAAITMILTD